MAKSIRMKAVSSKDGIVEVKALINHPMESGMRKDKQSGQFIPAHFIKSITVTANEQIIMTALWGVGVSKYPFVGFKYKGKKGDKVKLVWVDNKGEQDSMEVKAV